MCKQILSLAYLHKHTISGMVSQESEKEERKTNAIEFFHIHIIAKLLCPSHEKHIQQFGVHHQRKGAWGGKHSMQSSKPSSTPNYAFETTKCLPPHPPMLLFYFWVHDKFQVHCMWAGLPISNMVKFNVFEHGFC